MSLISQNLAFSAGLATSCDTSTNSGQWQLQPLPPRLDLCNHSADGFEWSYRGTGPAQLALAILADALGDDELALAMHQAFMVAKIAKLDRDPGWSIAEHGVLKWVQAQQLPPSKDVAASG